MAQDLILAIDQGTTSSRALVFDRSGKVRAVAAREFRQIYPRPGWVEHDPEEIWSTTVAVCREVLGKLGGTTPAAIGITNQRETTLIWDKRSGQPLYNAIVWQDRRTADLCRKLKGEGYAEKVQDITGLLLDPYFSATKIAWILDHIDGARERARRGELAFGTIESFLLWRLTGRHASDATNASRTLLYDLSGGGWSEGLLDLFDIPLALMPEITDCVAEFGQADGEILGARIPVCAMIGDQQSAAVGQACLTPGMMKATYGTGCFALTNTGDEIRRSQHRLLSTVAWQIGGKRSFSIEGSIFIAGAAVQWLRDALGILETSPESENLARQAESDSGVYFVPAFSGLGAPYWDPDARGAILGLTRGSGREEVARACLEAMAYQTHDLLTAMAGDGVKAERLRVDGGMVANEWLCQDLADMLDMPVDRPAVTETTALGAALLAGLGADFYETLDGTADIWSCEKSFKPTLDDDIRARRLAGWSDAVARIRSDRTIGE